MRKCVNSLTSSLLPKAAKIIPREGGEQRYLPGCVWLPLLWVLLL